MKLVLVFLFATLNAFAIPQLINYQGQLTSPSGSPLDTTVAMTLTLYDVANGGVPLWVEAHPSIVVTDGLFNVQLGSQTALDDFFGVTRWLGITVGNNTEMIPREQIVSVAQAYRVGTVDGASGGTITGDVVINTKLNVGNGNTNDGAYAVVHGQNNHARGVRSVIAGGGGPVLSDSNSVLAQNGFIGGGSGNFVEQLHGVVGGGINNKARSIRSFVGGGSSNTVSSVADNGGIACGDQNSVTQDRAFIGGGSLNQATNLDAVIAGGNTNIASGQGSFVGGGSGNSATGSKTVTGGGNSNTAGGSHDVIAGGDDNGSTGDHNSIVGGYSQFVSGSYVTLCGGYNNSAQGLGVTVGGGLSNFAAPESLSTIGGGQSNSASGNFSFVGGGYSNNVSNRAGVIVGGWDNTINHTNADSNENCFIGGGYSNIISNAHMSTLCGGDNNSVTGWVAAVGGGRNNSAEGYGACVPGGTNNTAAGTESFVCGANVNASANHAFAFGDGSENFSPGVNNTASFLTTGGFRIWTANPTSSNIGTRLAAGGSSWIALSDSATKENRRTASGADVLTKIASLPIDRWNYKHQDDRTEHIGPMAQDFWNAFHLGSDSLGIETIDADGVLFSAVQALNDRCNELQRQNDDLRQLMQQMIQLGMNKDENTSENLK